MLEKYRETVEERLGAILPAEEAPPLSAAMRYSLLAGGKRLRPCMLLAAVEMMGENWREALEYACALEMIHTYSLIHDDLPAMDAARQAHQPRGLWRWPGSAGGRRVVELRL